MKIVELDKEYTENRDILLQGYLAIGLLLAIFDDDHNIFLVKESTNKPNIKNANEWGIPAETCKLDENLQDTLARCLFEELNTSDYSGLSLIKGGYIETNFIDSKGFARVVVARCDRNRRDLIQKYDLDAKVDPSFREIQESRWVSLEDINQIKLRRGMFDILRDIRNTGVLNNNLETLVSFEEFLSNARINSSAPDVVMKEHK